MTVLKKYNSLQNPAKSYPLTLSRWLVIPSLLEKLRQGGQLTQLLDPCFCFRHHLEIQYDCASASPSQSERMKCSSFCLKPTLSFWLFIWSPESSRTFLHQVPLCPPIALTSFLLSSLLLPDPLLCYLSYPGGEGKKASQNSTLCLIFQLL